MDIAVLTFPGHTFQTTLSIKSLIQHCDPEQIFVLVDDIAGQSWLTYEADLQSWLDGQFPKVSIIYKKYSSLDFQNCASGWWRAQLVKLYIDTLLPGTEIFLVDGDVIFDRWAELKNVTPYTLRTPGLQSPVATLHANYVKTVLGIDQGHLSNNGNYIATSPVPFRRLSALTLQALRTHVETIHQKNFLQLHLDWFQDQSIIGFEDPPTRMIMSEWELIECYKTYVQQIPLQLIELGSGYAIDQNTVNCPEPVIYKHSYQRDVSIGKSWFDSVLGKIPTDLWNSAEAWATAHEPGRT